MSSSEDDPGGLLPMGVDQQGRQMFAMPYNESLAQKAVEKGLHRQTDGTTHKTEPEAADNDGSTPTPDTEREGYGVGRRTGPIRRFNDVFTDLGSVQLEALGLDGSEIASATSTLRDEMYRSQFPLVQPRFAVKCEDDDCGAEYDEQVEFCIECARREMKKAGETDIPSDPEEVPEQYRGHPVRPPSPSEKRKAERKAESVNKEGQSLRDVMKMAEDDQSRLGVSTVVIKKDFAVAAGDSPFFERGEIIHEEPDEIVRADPKRLVPVVDENSRVGGWKYTCPVHRKKGLVSAGEYHSGETTCEHCGANLREVFFVEKKGTGRTSRTDVEKYFFQEEVVTWARYYPRLHGLDGLSPVHHVWLKQAILHWMDIYGAAYYDPESDSYPNKFMVVHTTNPQAWEKQFDKAEEETRENPYNEQILMNEYSGESNSTPEVQTIDLMNDELLGQDQQLKDQFKQDIRSNYGVTNVFDSELSDAGGLNNEGLQMEVTDRSIASAMHDTVSGPLDELSKRLGISDYIYEFVPPRDEDLDQLQQSVRIGQDAAGAGLDARIEDGKVEVPDGEFEADEDGGGGLADLFGDFSGLEDVVSHKAEDHDVDVYRIVAPDDGGYEADLLGVVCDMPSHQVYCDWYLPAHGDDQLDNAHVSIYGSLGDLDSVTDGDIEYVATVGSAAEFKASAPDPEPRGRPVDERAGAAPPSDADEADGTDETPSTSAGKREPERSRHPEGGGTGNPNAADEADRIEAVRKLEDAYRHIVWADEETKAEPFWHDHDDVPDFVESLVDGVLSSDALWSADFETLPGADNTVVGNVLRESLLQPQGWSLSSITENLSEALGVGREDAELVARTETSKVLNEAREEGYRRTESLDEDDRLFKWIGPADHRTTDACEWLKDKTEDGVTWDRLIELEKEATDKFFDHLDFRKHIVHPNERHTFVETFKADHPAAAGPIEVEYKIDLAPAVAGTFVEVDA